MAAGSVSLSATQYRSRAHALAQEGRADAALEELERGVAEHPESGPLANSAGDFAMRAGDPEKAARHFANAVKLDGENSDFAINLSIALTALGRFQEAIAVLERHEEHCSRDPRYCSARANAARSSGDLAEAQRWYDLCLAAAPGQPRALHGRARVALERGDSDAVARFEATLDANKGDPDAWLGYVEALDAAGRRDEARGLAEQLVAQASHWIAALRALAQLRVGSGEHDFDDHFATAATQRPDDPSIPQAHVDMLEQHDRFADALAISKKAERAFPDLPQFRLRTATLAGYLGETDRADARYSALTQQDPARWLMEARFRLQTGECDRAAKLLDQLLEERPGDIAGWAARDLLWRLQGDERADWLHGQEGLVQLVELPDAKQVLADAVPLLHRLHDSSAFPLGQSLRGGTQTRGILFRRPEPELRRLHDCLTAALETYRSKLPSADPAHPLLRHRDKPWAITSSWSVRLDGGGDHHTAHLHPEGIVSSALYCELPPEMRDGSGTERAGWIELGRPPAKMHVELDAITALEPREGFLALFPSTLYHGTRPFAGGRRMTVAFDVTAPSDAA
ncbi:2OG-Fe(II) oxygenase family protein [Aurantiacibacter sp. MUD61]|uniref:2OG-Fe(II) oxygenase family protein n=1 Tax=Aurantiacibacter sp. MUD61 TaxID=3009083 RepID=UPI0022F0D86C|nr:tetratricopeptide repeat protein [Aurantiacibacter sp. MUD61]